jgi:integrase
MGEKLTHLQVAAWLAEYRKQGRPGALDVGGAVGLRLRLSPTGTAAWTLRATVNGKRVERGLGGYPALTLAQARAKATEARDGARQGNDPKAAREAARQAAEDAARATANQRTFEQAAAACINANETRWRNIKHGQQWRNTLAQYAFPLIGSKDVATINHADVVRVLAPIWGTKHETAFRLRGRIKAVLDFAEAHGWRVEGQRNPAAQSARLDAALPPLARSRAGVAGHRGHHAAMGQNEMPMFMARLAEKPGIGARALAFAVLTAARSGEVRGMTWAEVEATDAGMVWTVPGARMKAGREHRVPLPRQAQAILVELRAEAIAKASEAEGTDADAAPPTTPDPDGLVFPSPRTKTMLSDMVFTAMLRDMGLAVTTHGFRSTFRDWCSDNGFDRELAEAALAHAVGSAVEAAYRRTDLMERRRALMQAWANFIEVAGLA